MSPTARAWAIWLGLAGLLVVIVKLLEPAPPVAPPEMSRTPGVRLFYKHECGQCHTLEALPGARGTMGPRLEGVGKRAGQRVRGRAAREYLHESLVEPGRFLVEGYLNGMPSYAGLPPAELQELVDYLERQ